MPVSDFGLERGPAVVTPSEEAAGAVRRPSRALLDRPAVFFAALVVALGILFCGGWTNYNSVMAMTAATEYKGSLPPVDRSSPTGYADGLRRVIMPRGVDGCHWVMNAQRMAHEGKWRVRQMPDDNFPTGREMHWSHLFLWWLVFLGWVSAAFTGLPIGAAIENAAVWAALPIHALVIVGVPLAVRKAFGWGAAAVLALALSTVYTFASFFFVGAPDHHGLVATGVLCCGLFIAVGGAGWIQTPGHSGSAVDVPRAADARFWFMWSGVAGGAGMWISSATTIPVFIGLGIGIAISFLFIKIGAGGDASYEPRVWRVWGISAATASIFFYLLEYAPDHFGWRLEVNHPLYALALAGAGELLFRVSRWRVSNVSLARGAGEWVLLVAAVIVLVVPPILIVGLGATVFSIKDPFLWALHGQYIHEFKPLLPWLQAQSPQARMIFLNPLWLLFFAVLRLVFTASISARWKAAVVVPAAAACFVTVLGCGQTRWINIADTLWLATLATVVGCVMRTTHRPRFWWGEKALAGCFVAAMIVPMSQLVIRDFARGITTPAVATESDLEVIFARDIAYRLRALGGRDVPVVASAPTTTTWMMYFGGLRGLGTLYWENAEGLKAAARIYSARDEAEAVRLIQEHRVSHIAIFSFEPFVRDYPALMGVPVDTTEPGTVLARMTDGISAPRWARELPVPVPAKLPSAWALIYDVRRARDAR